MTADIIQVRFPWRRVRDSEVTPQPQQPPQRPDLETRLDLIEAAMKTAYEERMDMARQVAEGNRRIREQDFHIRQLQEDKKEAMVQNGNLLQQLGSLRGRLEISEAGHKEQGGRIGSLEHEVSNLQRQAAQVPLLRAHVFKLQSIVALYQQWGQQLVAILVANNLPVVEPPPIDLKQIEEQTWKLSQVEAE